jgi:hypothetical protein
MTPVATEITLSLADRVRDWSRQERDLAMALRGLRAVAAPYPAPLPPSPTALRPSPLPHSMVPAAPTPSVNNISPSVADQWIDWIGRQVPTAGPTDLDLGDRPLPHTSPVPPTRAGLSEAGRSAIPFDLPTPDPAVPRVAPTPAAALGPFDDFIATVTGTGVPPAPLPPPARFMVRVAPAQKPHRPTKRNYDYFEELNVRLAAQAAAREQSGRQ